MKALFFVILIALCCAANVSATTLHVPYEYPTIQDALDASVYADTVLIAPGTYTGDRNINLDVWHPIQLASESGNPSDVIIDGENRAARAVISHQGFDLVGVTLTRFNSEMGDGTYGVFLNNVGYESAIINCVIRECRNGIVYVGPFSNSKIYIRNSLIENNTVDISERALIVSQNTGSVFMWDTIIRNNQCAGPALVLLLSNSTTTVERCTITNNTTPSTDVATIWARNGGTLAITSTAITGNGAVGLARSYGPAVLVNTTIAGNVSPLIQSGSGINGHEANFSLDHCIVWGNIGSPDILIDIGGVSANCSDFPNDTPDGNNISVDPMFCDSVHGDYSLRDVSPALHQDCGPMGAYTQPGCVTPTAVQPTTWSAIKAQYR